MAKGLDKHQERLQALSLFGKDLTRRASSQCELCQASGTKLFIHEVEPVPKEPDFDHCIFICETCSQELHTKRTLDVNHWRCLNTAVWSTIPAVQVSAVLLLRQLQDHSWAVDLLDQAYLSEEVEGWLATIKP